MSRSLSHEHKCQGHSRENERIYRGGNYIMFRYPEVTDKLFHMLTCRAGGEASAVGQSI